MSETTSNKVQPAKKANAKKTANGTDSKLFVSPVVSAIFWTISIVLVVAVILGNWYYTSFVAVDEGNLSRLLRVAIVIVGFAVALIVALLTNKGRTLLQFGRQSYKIGRAHV